MKAVLHIDNAVGESRRCLVDENGAAFRLSIERWSQRGRIARVDQIWWGRAAARTPSGAGWFVDLGLDQPGVIDTTKASVTEGAMISVRIKAEAWAGKSALLSLHALPASVIRPDRPGLHLEALADPLVAGCEITQTADGPSSRALIESVIEDATASLAPLPGGGDIAIETTRGLTAIDVDTGGRTGPKLALDANLVAAREIARQIALRSIGGLVITDFVSMQGSQDRRAVAEALRANLAATLGRSSEVLDLSPLGLCEMAIARRTAPLAETLGEGAEREALDTLRQIETAGRVATGARIRARVSPDALAWLDRDPIGWREALANRIGARWTLEPGQPGQPLQVWSET